ncbi:MAG: serine/threonine-protein kinase, partial [Victivallaceae bacterium]
MNDIEGRPEASDNAAVPSVENTESAIAENPALDSFAKSLRQKIDEDSLYKRIAYHKLKLPEGKLPSSKSETRYKIKKLIGEGSMGDVFAARDYNFDREVALKLPKKADSSGHGRDDFIKEATVSAGLEHPNIIPVYDLNIDNNGNIYMSMRKVNGHSLKQYIDSVKSADESLQLMKIEEILLIFLKICDAMEYAHSKGQIHQDIKPENIMIGNFGEVFLIDWGSSSSNDEEVCLTPAYMSPEQAATGYADERSDVFCLAATLFHVLTLRLPTMAETTRELWTKRCQGIIDPLTNEERKKVPPPLMAIALKGLEANPEKRYQTVAELSRDLKQYQGGLAVSAFHDTVIASFARWYRRNRKPFWMSLLALFVVAVCGTYVWQEKLKEIAYWGRPICTEKFKDGSWNDRWVEYQGAFEVQDGRLVTVPGKGDSFILIYRKKLSGSIAIEFDGEIIPGTLPCDLSAVWAEDVVWDKNGTKILNINEIYYLQTGAWGNNFSRISKINETLSYSKFILKEGQKYKIRA